jgi:hypothetical protein
MMVAASSGEEMLEVLHKKVRRRRDRGKRELAAILEADDGRDHDDCAALVGVLRFSPCAHGASHAPFSRITVYQCIWARYPRQDHDRSSLDSNL